MRSARALARALTCASFLMSGAALAQEAESTRVDGLAALIGGFSPGDGVDMILRSDVELRARMALLSQVGASGAVLSPSLLEATLNELIGEALIAREALRVQIAQPSKTDVARERQRLVLMAGGNTRVAEMLHEIGADSDEIDSIAQRRAVAAAFLSANLEGAMVVTDGEIEQRYRADAATYEGRDPKEARELIRARLAREALTRNIERWVRVLRARSPVRVFAAFKSS